MFWLALNFSTPSVVVYFELIYRVTLNNAMCSGKSFHGTKTRWL